MAKQNYTLSIEEKVMDEFSVWCAKKKKKKSHIVEKLIKNLLLKEGISEKSLK